MKLSDKVFKMLCDDLKSASSKWVISNGWIKIKDKGIGVYCGLGIIFYTVHIGSIKFRLSVRQKREMKKVINLMALSTLAANLKTKASEEEE